MDRRRQAYLCRLQGRKADGHASRAVPEQPPFLSSQCAAVWRRGCTACRTLPLFCSSDPYHVGSRIPLLRSVAAVRRRVDPAVRAARHRPLLCHRFSHLQRALRHHLQHPQPIFPTSNNG